MLLGLHPHFKREVLAMLDFRSWYLWLKTLRDGFLLFSRVLSIMQCSDCLCLPLWVTEQQG